MGQFGTFTSPAPLHAGKNKKSCNIKRLLFVFCLKHLKAHLKAEVKLNIWTQEHTFTGRAFSSVRHQTPRNAVRITWIMSARFTKGCFFPLSFICMLMNGSPASYQAHTRHGWLAFSDFSHNSMKRYGNKKWQRTFSEVDGKVIYAQLKRQQKYVT